MDNDLVLIDAYSQIFRCYYAIGHLTNSRGEPTNAIFAFTRLLLKLQQEFPGRNGALVFDCGRVQFRLQLNPGYKANRLAMPEELRRQIPMIRELAAAFGWPLLEEPEFEADDLIAALAGVSAGPVKIISSDKDLAQLVNEKVTQLVPDARSHLWDVRTPERIREKFSVRPDQIIDYLALLGDSSDNIAGVPGIGPKTAAALLKQHGSIEAMLASPETIVNERQRRLIVENTETLRCNRKLIRLRTDLPEHFCNLDQCCRRSKPDWPKIAAICDAMELKSIRKELPGPPADPEEGLPLFAAAHVAADAPSVTAENSEPERPAESYVQDDLFSDL